VLLWPLAVALVAAGVFRNLTYALIGPDLAAVVACVLGVLLFFFLVYAPFAPAIRASRVFWARSARGARILTQGRRAVAQVRSVGSPGARITINGERVYRLVLRIFPELGRVYEATVDTVVPAHLLSKLEPGTVHTVRVDPDDRTGIALDPGRTEVTLPRPGPGDGVELLPPRKARHFLWRWSWVGLPAAFFATLVAYDGCVAAGPDHASAQPSSDPAAFDVVADYEVARRLVSDEARPLGIEAEKVESDGTVNVFASYEPRVTYRFVAPALPAPQPPGAEPEPEEDLPIGARPAPDPALPPEEPPTHRLYEVTLEQPGKREATRRDEDAARARGRSFPYRWVRQSALVRHEGRENPSEQPVLEAPACPFGTLWQRALSLGVPTNAVAGITYDETGYRLVIDEIDVDLRFDAECELLGVLGIAFEAVGRRAAATLTINDLAWGEVPWDYDLGHHYRELLLRPGEYRLQVKLGRLRAATATVDLEAGKREEVRLAPGR
jgi:hypothetical protein